MGAVNMYRTVCGKDARIRVRIKHSISGIVPHHPEINITPIMCELEGRELWAETTDRDNVIFTMYHQLNGELATGWYWDTNWVEILSPLPVIEGNDIGEED